MGGTEDNNQSEAPITPGNKLPQYLAAISVCMGAVAAGTVLGFTGNISKEKLGALISDPAMDSEAYSWVGSFANLGGMVMCFPIGFICDRIGRKPAMLTLICPFMVGWLLLIFATNIEMIYAARFLTGLAGGAFCVSAPLYTSEIAEKEIRGTLGSYFQLLLTVGILLAYLLGKWLNAQQTAIVCGIVPLIFGVLFFLQPETPVYLMKRGRDEAARTVLRRLRGPAYDVEREAKHIQRQLEEEARVRTSFRDSFAKRATKLSLVICFGLMFFQQLGGINAVIFYSGAIFEEAGTSLDKSDAALLVGVLQVLATFAASLFVDRLGRRILLLVSALMMAVAGIILGVYFSLKDRSAMSAQEITDIGFMPILALCIFIVMFSVGFGPIPWMVASEVMPAEIKSNGSSAAGTFNWFLAFLVTKFYEPLTKTKIGTDSTFYIFAGVSVLGMVFVMFVVPETKGKSLEQIQRELNREPEIAGNGVDNKNFEE